MVNNMIFLPTLLEKDGVHMEKITREELRKLAIRAKKTELLNRRQLKFLKILNMTELQFLNKELGND